jgi:DNA-3-methyladenine glycosylase II
VTDPGRLTPATIAVAERRLSRACPVMERLIDAHGPCRLKINPRPDVFRSLAAAILAQQISTAAAETIRRRVAHAAGGGRFPAPRRFLETAEATIAACGVSRAKIASLRDLASRIDGGEIPKGSVIAALPDAEIVAILTATRGIGPWTAEMFLLRTRTSRRRGPRRLRGCERVSCTPSA